jgi:hypothetical protein
MPDKAWKRLEREAATIIGGRRQPSQGVPAPDILGPGNWKWEHKARQNLPQWLLDAIAQSDDHDPPSGVIISYHPGQGRRVERFAVVRLELLAQILRDENVTDDPQQAI